MYPKPGKSTQRKRAKARRDNWRETCREIWATRPRICEGCYKPLGKEAKAHYFAHVHHRGMGGNPDESRNHPDNIMILCMECHEKDWRRE